MRIKCSLLLSVLFIGCPVLVKAVTVRVQDPNYTNVTTSPTSFMFSVCPGAGDPGGPYLDLGNPISADGCFGGVNQVGSSITSISLTFQNTYAVQNSGANIAESDIFQSANFIAPADLTDSSEIYTFLFRGGALVQGQTFVITEDGVEDPSQFPLVTVTFTTSNTSVTPEPEPLLLMGTGLLCLGGLCRQRGYV